MALISDEDIQKVIEANDLVQIAGECVPDIKQKGGKFVACCPFHKEKTPSFQIDPNLQLWHCFGCGEGGNIVTFVEKIYDMNFPEAMEFLAEKANIQLKKSGGKTFDKSNRGKLLAACREAANFYHIQLTKAKGAGNNAARKYLSSRNMGSDVAKRWMLGYAPNNNQLTKYLLQKNFSSKTLIDANLCIERNRRLVDRFYDRVMFPIFDAQKNVIAFGGRIMSDAQPKYLNSSENALFHKSKVLYGFDKAKANMTSTGMAVVVEGYTDVIAMHEAGINFAVATLGTALTRQHIRLLNQHAKNKIIYLFDGDEAGQRAAERALNFIDQMQRPEIYSKRAELLALTLPNNMDPKEYIDANGADSLRSLLKNAKPLLDYGIERKISNYDLSKPGQKSKAAAAALQILAPIKDSLLAKEYCSTIADITGMRAEDIIDGLAKLKKPTEYQQSQDTASIKIPQAQTNGSKTKKLEIELLSLFAKNPENFIEIIDDDFQYKWTSASHEKLYDFIAEEITKNPKISAKELVLKIHQKSPQAANMITKMSNMYDMKNNPTLHGKYTIARLNLEQINLQINKLKAEFNKMPEGDQKNSTFIQINEMLKQQKILKQKVNEMI